MENSINSTPECCPQFNPEPWDDKIIEWDNKIFIKDKVRTFFYMPFGFGKAMKRLNKKMEAANANSPEWLCLSEHKSAWKMDLYLAVDKEIPNTENIRFSGKYFSKVYEGPFKDSMKWIKDFQSIKIEKGFKESPFYMWYTTCPKCAKKYGKNYVVLISQS